MRTARTGGGQGGRHLEVVVVAKPVKKRTDIILLACLFMIFSCTNEAKRDAEHDAWRKIEFDLTQLDANGLRGPPDGKVSVSYEFCIPNTPQCKAEVKAIDQTVQFMPGSRGRIGATKNQCLCIGSTHQNDYLGVLRALSELTYVDRIIECHFE